MDEKMVQLAEKLVSKLGDVAPVALEAAKLKAVNSLFVGLFLCGVAYASFYWCRRLVDLLREGKVSDEEGVIFGIIGLGGLTLLTGLLGATDVLSLPNWYGLWRPEVYLAYQLMP